MSVTLHSTHSRAPPSYCTSKLDGMDKMLILSKEDGQLNILPSGGHRPVCEQLPPVKLYKDLSSGLTDADWPCCRSKIRGSGAPP